MLVLGGAYEFLPTSGEYVPENKQKTLPEAFLKLDYDLGILSPAEKDFLKSSPRGIPPNWIDSREMKVVEKKLQDGSTAAIIILPYLEKGSNDIPDDIVDSAEKLFEEYRSKCDIVIAMSSWGYFREKKFLGSIGVTENPPDILLGSGDGPGMTGSLAAQGRTLWVRSYPTGKAVNRIDIFKFPTRDPGFKWVSDENAKWFLQTLHQNQREDPKVAELLADIVDEK
ncbi:hypothetical protein [Maridesulfovibrio sp.]|uniref:UshA-like (seleno)protein family 2 n=1 Tax=Maridesulfovibrio sp. TaxID=2795000 RepID=UPI002A18DF2B|nr:hypothetical protein [Maridesulfovibrio sp.]